MPAITSARLINPTDQSVTYEVWIQWAESELGRLPHELRFDWYEWDRGPDDRLNSYVRRLDPPRGNPELVTGVMAADSSWDDELWKDWIYARLTLRPQGGVRGPEARATTNVVKHAFDPA